MHRNFFSCHKSPHQQRSAAARPDAASTDPHRSPASAMHAAVHSLKYCGFFKVYAELLSGWK